MKITYINSNNLEPHTLAVHEYGNPSNKAVVLLHAFTHNGLFFKPLADYLSNIGYYVICPDMPGRGASSYLSNSKNYNYWLYVDDLFLILNFLKVNQVTLFGNSMGGILSVLFTEKYPRMVKKIILNDIGVVAPAAESMRIGMHVGRDTYKENKGDMIKRIDEEFIQSNLQMNELEYIFEIYTTKINNGYTFRYDQKLADAFWFKNRQIKIPDLDFSDNFGYLARTCKELELYVIKGEKSHLLDESNFERLISCNQCKGYFIAPHKGHLPIFFSETEKQMIAKWLK